MNMQVQNITFKQNIYSPQTAYRTKPLPYDSVSFSGKEDSKRKLQKAKLYANLMRVPNLFWPKTLQEYNLDKLEGLQTGLKTFDNLSMKEIAFMFEDLRGIMIKRGCSNQCLHCYANALPEQKEHGQYINRMPYEDFLALTDDVKTLRNRLGTNLTKYNHNPYTDVFYDADCMEISLFDKDGIEHDFTEIHSIFHDAFNTKSIFDTAGWNHKNPKMQARAEKYVNYLTDLENEDKFYQINLSLSPFNPIYARALELGYDPKTYSSYKKNSSMPKGEQLYRTYIDRMANMLFTFSPLIYTDKLGIIARPLKNDTKNMEGFTISDYYNIVNSILQRLPEMYEEDLKGDKKIVQSKEQILYLQIKYAHLFQKTHSDLVPEGRLKKLYFKRNPEMTEEVFQNKFKIIKNHNDMYNELKQKKNFDEIKYLKMINTDGRLYLYDALHYIPTEIQLNISTKDKITPKLYPEPETDFTITKEMIKKAGK